MLVVLGNRLEADRACRAGLREFPLDLELRFRRGTLLHQAGRLDEAVHAYEDLLANPEERHFTSVDRGIGGFKARQNLAAVHADRGDWPRAEAQWRQVTSEQPGYRPGWRGLGDALLRQGRLGPAADLAQRLLQDERVSIEGVLLAARIAVLRGEVLEAEGLLRAVATAVPEDPEPLQDLARLAFERTGPSKALPVLNELVARIPDDAAAHHNLGTALAACGRHPEAVESFRRSLHLRPSSPATWEHLAEALQAAGCGPEAEQARAQALELRRTRE